MFHKKRGEDRINNKFNRAIETIKITISNNNRAEKINNRLMNKIR